VTQGVETRLDGQTLVVRIPMRFQRRGGRKRMVTPDGGAIVPTFQVAAGWHAGEGARARGAGSACSMRVSTSLSARSATPRTSRGDAENISKSYVSRILRLALLVPDIVEAILAGRTDQALMLEQLEQPLPASWEEQRTLLKPRALCLP